MSIPTGSAAFLDTSIQIARIVHGPNVIARISERIATYTLTVTSQIVKQEYKRRLLQEIQWCLNQLNDRRNPKTFDELFRHITDILPPQQNRKRNICSQICLTVLPLAGRGDLTERAKRHFRTLLRTGMTLFELEVGHIISDSQCACAAYPIKEERPYEKYDFGPTECSKCTDDCGVRHFLCESRENLELIRQHLDLLPSILKSNADGKLTELGKISEFLVAFLDNGDDPEPRNPCLTIGDLMIALESANIPNFYTMNGKESQFLSRWLNQTLIVRRRNPAHEDIICEAANATWPSF